MTDQPTGRPGDARSAPELEFLQCWRPLIDRVGGDGGQARAAKHMNWTTSTGKQVHATWAGPGVGFIAWTVGLSMNTYKGNAYRSCRSNRTGVNIDVAWNSESLHNGAKLVIIDSVKLSNGKWRDVGPALTISKAVSWPGHPAFGGQYHALVYTPGTTTTRPRGMSGEAARALRIRWPGCWTA